MDGWTGGLKVDSDCGGREGDDSNAHLHLDLEFLRCLQLARRRIALLGDSAMERLSYAFAETLLPASGMRQWGCTRPECGRCWNT